MPRPLCINGCGKLRQFGRDYAGKWYRHCCRSCATDWPDLEKHDDNCEGARKPGVKHSERTGAESPKEWLDSLLQIDARMREHSNAIFDLGVGRLSDPGDCSSLPLTLELLGDLVRHELMKPVQRVLQMPSDENVKKWRANFDRAGTGRIGRENFRRMCKVYMNDIRKDWFPEPVPTSTRVFVRKNEANLRSIYEFCNEQPMGRGSWGTVSKVTHKTSGEQRVCKSTNFPRPENRSLQLKEVENLAQLDHPYVLKIFEYFEEENGIYLITELCKGGDLDSTIFARAKNGQFSPERDICEIMRQSLSAVAYLHNKQILHKDLKPANLMFMNVDDLTIKVIDFGLSEMHVKDVAKSGGGTLLYSAPESFYSRLELKSDIWSMGVIFYNIVAGNFPFCARWDPSLRQDANYNKLWTQQTIELICKHDMSRNVRMDQVSAPCFDLLQKMMTKDPRARPSAKECLEHEWFTKVYKQRLTCPVATGQRLYSYTHMSKMKQALFFLVATLSPTTNSLSDLRQIFTHCDKEHRGTVAPKKLENMLRAADVPPLDASRVVHALDLTGIKEISWTEFLAGESCAEILEQPNKIRAAFQAMARVGDCAAAASGLTQADVVETFAGKEAQKEVREKWQEVVAREWSEQGWGKEALTEDKLVQYMKKEGLARLPGHQLHAVCADVAPDSRA